MATIIGIGGCSCTRATPHALAGWYRYHLGFALRRLAEDDGSITHDQELYHRDLDAPSKRSHTVFAP